jgi:soluble lytic murein transglycosylase-like protein
MINERKKTMRRNALIFFPVGAIVLLAGSAPFLEAAGAKATLAPLIDKIASRHQLPADLLHAIIRAESAYDIRAVSPKGASGLMQLMPDTAEQYGVKDVFDPEENLEGGAKYLKDLVRLYDGKRDLVLAAYNAGQAAVKKYDGIPPYSETRAYIDEIRASYESPIIRDRATIYKYYDAEGRLCYSTNRPALAPR